jgi:hypothetical protein
MYSVYGILQPQNGGVSQYHNFLTFLTMSLFAQFQKNKTVEQIQSWNNQAIQSMNQAKSSVDSLKAQLVAMSTNPDYTPAECAEVQAMLVSIVNLSKSLFPTE